MFNSNRNEEGTVSAQVEITGGRIETKDFPVSGKQSGVGRSGSCDHRRKPEKYIGRNSYLLADGRTTYDRRQCGDRRRNRDRSKNGNNYDQG